MADNKENKEVKEKEVKESKERQHKKEEKQAQSIIRIAGRDVDGALPLNRALSKVKGIGDMMSNALSNAIERTHNISRTTPVGSLT
ncbi:MAG: hypothetical protein M1385_02305 [Candidatus Marsarchaeota archaeon]|nr:hypothetical protein [Candidatus Marsarchaeota archaeon]